jgi:hypothetical protein
MRNWVAPTSGGKYWEMSRIRSRLGEALLVERLDGGNSGRWHRRLGLWLS